MADLAASLWVPLLVLSALPAVIAAPGGRQLEAPERLAWASALALSWSMLGGAVLGAVSQLSATTAWCWLATGALGSLMAAWRAGVRLGDGVSGWHGWMGLALLVPPALLLLLLATVPPWYRDSLVYHLALPRHFAQQGGVAWPDDNIFAWLPIGWESALALLHAVGSGADHDPAFNPRLAGAWSFVGAALATVALARAAGAARPLAAAAGALLLLLPCCVEFGSSAYVEGALLLLVTLALCSLLRSAADRNSGAGWLHSAVLAGLACWIKYPALAAVVFLALAAPWLEARRRERTDWRSWVDLAWRWGLVAAVVGCPFYVRNLLLRGNPFFPTAYGLFGGEGWDAWRAWAYGVTLEHYGYGHTPLDYLLLPWRLFTQRSFEGGFEGSIGPLVALGAPIGAWLLWRGSLPAARRQAVALLLAWTAWMSLFWALTLQQARFYLPAVPALLALLAVGSGALRAHWAGARSSGPRLVWCVAGALLALQLSWSWAPIGELWRRQATSDWLTGRLERDALLARMLPESYQATRELERFVPESGRVWLVWMRGYTYYLRRPYRIDCVFEAWRFEALLDRTELAQHLGGALRADGISHLLINHRFFLQHDNADLRPGRTDLLRDRFAAALAAGELAPVHSWGTITLYAVAPPEGRLARIEPADGG